jgi:hypothetical protein
MQHKQREYALSRLKTILDSLHKQINDKYGPVAPTMSYKEKLQLARAGKVKIKKHLSSWNEDALETVFDFEDIIEKRMKDPKVKSRENKIRDLELMYDEIRDEVMLGDAQEGMRLLKKLSEFKV